MSKPVFWKTSQLSYAELFTKHAKHYQQTCIFVRLEHPPIVFKSCHMTKTLYWILLDQVSQGKKLSCDLFIRTNFRCGRKREETNIKKNMPVWKSKDNSQRIKIDGKQMNKHSVVEEYGLTTIFISTQEGTLVKFSADDILKYFFYLDTKWLTTVDVSLNPNSVSQNKIIFRPK